MRIGLIDVDGHNYPNLVLMKLSAYFKAHGNTVSWYDKEESYDVCFASKVFSFTDDIPEPVNASMLVKGGTGYHYPDGGIPLPTEIEHIRPDYGLYGKEDFSCGFLTRGCPRGCDFCIVGHKEGKRSRKVADLGEFWNGEKYIDLLDPNFFACKDWGGLSEQIINSRAYINFSQGCDIRVMTKDKFEALKHMKIRQVHFAWDRYEDADLVVPAFEQAKEILGWNRRKMIVYVLVNFDTTFDQDLERIYTLKKLGYDPYVMIYEKNTLPRGHILKKLQRWVNNRIIWGTCGTFDEYLRYERQRKKK